MLQIMIIAARVLFPWQICVWMFVYVLFTLKTDAPHLFGVCTHDVHIWRFCMMAEH